MKIIKEIHYDKPDPQYDSEDDDPFFGDYRFIILKDEDIEIAYFGDYYHDKGLEKCEGFIKGMEYVLKEEIEVETINLADAEY